MSPILCAVAGGARRAGLWSPIALNPSGWYDAELSAKTLSGSEVSQWDDLSGNSRHASQGTSANRPTYDGTDKWLSFDGSNDFLNPSAALLGSGNSPHTIFAVVRPDSTGTHRYFYAQGSESANQLPHVGFAGSAYAHNWFGSNYTAGTISTGTWYIVAYPYDGSTRSIYSNGSLIGNNSYSSANNTTANPYIGRATTNYFLGKLRTLIVYQSALSDENRKRVEGYLAYVWGLQSSLPGDHPYRYNPPLM